MAKRIVVLERSGTRQFRAVLWADVPAARQPFHAVVGKVSAWKDASGAENSALASGAVAEKVIDVNYSTALNMAQMQTALEGTWADWQAEITASNPWVQYGRFWDGTTWTAAGVA